MASPNKSANPNNWSKMERVEQKSFTNAPYSEFMSYVEKMKSAGYTVRTTQRGKVRKVFVYKKA